MGWFPFFATRHDQSMTFRSNGVGSSQCLDQRALVSPRSSGTLPITSAAAGQKPLFRKEFPVGSVDLAQGRSTQHIANSVDLNKPGRPVFVYPVDPARARSTGSCKQIIGTVFSSSSREPDPSCWVDRAIWSVDRVNCENRTQKWAFSQIRSQKWAFSRIRDSAKSPFKISFLRSCWVAFVERTGAHYGPKLTSFKEAEARVILFALKEASSKGLSKVTLFADVKEVVDTINGKMNCTINPITFDNKLQCIFSFVEFLFIPRICNEAPHVLTKQCYWLGIAAHAGPFEATALAEMTNPVPPGELVEWK
ncbi:hypothetical protein CKAN_02437100 [Cinnamomum micranthum f. kanehirae]|uniref:RNase H type-1 domain-containing protein n=1 Tax=Cinnamomum micranthum f. kanehirae TaxID=337451 RepID=A0A3S4PUN7_9MAGN|nr:hypothetical protein CKAN_02437100 [Cinnamomum micranthum f. kanehirae]